MLQALGITHVLQVRRMKTRCPRMLGYQCSLDDFNALSRFSLTRAEPLLDLLPADMLHAGACQTSWLSLQGSSESYCFNMSEK